MTKTPHTHPGIPQDKKYVGTDEYIAKLKADLIATYKERDAWKVRAIGLDIALEGSNERFRKAEQALALRGEPVASPEQQATPPDDKLVPYLRRLPNVVELLNDCAKGIEQEGTEFYKSTPNNIRAAAWEYQYFRERCNFLERTLALRGEPVAKPDFAQLLAEADKTVKSKPTWKRFIDGNPLSNDIAVWMAQFAMLYAAPISGERVREACAKVLERRANELKEGSLSNQLLLAAMLEIRALPLAAQPEGK